jgi:hypothetical protein
MEKRQEEMSDREMDSKLKILYHSQRELRQAYDESNAKIEKKIEERLNELRKKIPIEECILITRPHGPHHWLHPDFDFMSSDVDRRCPGRGKYRRELDPNSNGLEEFKEA